MSVHRPPVATPDLDLNGLFSQGPRALRRWWVIATTAGEALGFAVPALVGVVAFDLHPALTLLLMVSAGALEGLVLGAAQSLVLRREFLGFSPTAWMGATSAGAGVAWFLGMLPSTFYPAWTQWPRLLTVLLGLVLGLALLVSIGFAQWTVLRHHVARSRSWVPANAAAWLLGLGVLLAITLPLWREGQPTALVALIGLLGGLGMALTMATVTGFWLGRLVAPRSGRTSQRPAPVGVPARDWAALGEPTDDFRVFDPRLLDDLPEPVQRWMRHVVAPGAALLTGVEVDWKGHLRTGDAWRSFCSRERATLELGFVWCARRRLLGLPVTGFDRYLHDAGETRWGLLRRLPLVRESGEDVGRSLAGRHAAELLAAVPATALDPSVRWEPIDHRSATAHITVGGEDQAVTVSVDPLGRLRRVDLERWGAPPGESFGRYRYGALLDEERRFDSYLVPTEVVAGWHIGTAGWDAGSSLRFRVVRCSFH